MEKISELLRFKSGIYCITNLVNGKRYVGSSKNVYNRIHEHVHNLNNNCAHNKHLQSAWNKYGESSFMFSLLQYCNPEDRFDYEQYYIDCLHPEYNLTEQVVANFGHSPSEESRLQISETLKRKYASGEITTYKQDHAWIKCSIYNIYTYELIKSCKNFKEAAEFLQCYKSMDTTIIGTVIKYKYAVVVDDKFKESGLSLRDYICKYYKTCISSNGNYLISEDPNHNLTYYITIKDCAENLGISKSMIAKHSNSTITNPYKPNKNNSIIYYSNEYILQDGAVQNEESSELLQTNIGESCDANPEISKEPKESLPS